ncbi:uncharacterized protein LOC117891864 [Drosophila subobscura]|uniref:uncharacterized protein LOC117891864 n=1 Tax=Drosophila subobscura TaxID=7241 RepID=UPI00155A496F|nr:uncharacterized protein LOC117891864 [Drosophila subobscura]
MFSYFIPLLIISALYDDSAAKTSWDCEPKSISAHSTNEGLLKVDVRMERVGRAGFFFTGTVFWNIDMDESVMVELELYRSTTGAESDYKLTPMSIPRQTFIEYINTYYRDMVIKNLGECSDLPRYEDQYVPPWPKKNYTLTRCTINGVGMPEVLLAGFYKIKANISHPEVNQEVKAIIKVTPKMF